MCRDVAKKSIKAGYKRSTQFFSLSKAQRMPECMRACARGPLKILIHYKAANNEEKPRFPRVFFAKIFSKLVYFII